MRISINQLRRIIKEEVSRLYETGQEPPDSSRMPPDSGASASALILLRASHLLQGGKDLLKKLQGKKVEGSRSGILMTAIGSGKLSIRL